MKFLFWFNDGQAFMKSGEKNFLYITAVAYQNVVTRNI